jgi:hypothetical protein
MSWRFRKTFKVLPGVKLNLTRYGISATIGAAPFSVNVGPRGVYRNLSIPGTGIWDRQRLDTPSLSEPTEQHPAALEPRAVPPLIPSEEAASIHSANAEMLKSQSMAELQKLFEEAYEERSALLREIGASDRETDRATRRFKNWDKGFLLKRVFPKSFASRRALFETAQAQLNELGQQLQLTVVATQIDVDSAQSESYVKMRNEFAAMSECQQIWDTLTRRRIDRASARSAASEAITQEPVVFGLGSCDLVQWDQEVLHLPNSNGGDLYIYPGFVLYRAAKTSFAIIDFREVHLASFPTRFVEDRKVPTDAQVVGSAWAKSNKDGGPDRRFKDNYQIPILLYGSLKFTSPGGLREEFQVSSAALAERFAMAWNVFQSSFVSAGQRTIGGEGKSTIHETLRIDHPDNKDAARKPSDVAAAYAKESEKARGLALEHGQFWEFTLTEELFRTKLPLLESKCDEFDKSLLSIPKRKFTGSEFIMWIGTKMKELGPMREEIGRCLSEDVRSSWGKPRESGDAVKILKSVDATIGLCRGFLNWELEVCASEPPAKLKGIATACRGITLSTIGDVRRFTDELHSSIEGFRSGSLKLVLNLQLSSPPQFDRVAEKVEEVNKHPEWVSEH